MATIRQRVNASGTAIYHVQVRIKGAPSHTASFRRLTDARRWAQRTETDLREGQYFPTTTARRHTLTDLIDRYRKTILPQKQPNTIRQQIGQLRWWQEHIGHLRLSDVAPSVIAEQRDLLAQTHKPGSVNGYLRTLSHVFTVAAQEWELLDHNPLAKVRRPRDTGARIRFLSDDERQRLLKACKESRNSSLYPVVVLTLSTAARKMEILSLRWPDVDLKRGQIVLHHTKNRERRVLPLAGLALQRMREHASVRRLDTDLVFPGRDGHKPADIEQAWDRARSRAGITDFRFHDLRHSAASYLAMNGASLAEIAAVLGHKSFDMVKRYAHLSEQHTAGVVKRMNEKIFKGL